MEQMQKTPQEPLLTNKVVDDTKSTDMAIEKEVEYQTTPRRWFILFSMSAILFASGLMVTAFAPVAV